MHHQHHFGKVKSSSCSSTDTALCCNHCSSRYVTLQQPGNAA